MACFTALAKLSVHHRPNGKFTFHKYRENSKSSGWGILGGHGKLKQILLCSDTHHAKCDQEIVGLTHSKKKQPCNFRNQIRLHNAYGFVVVARWLDQTRSVGSDDCEMHLHGGGSCLHSVCVCHLHTWQYEMATVRFGNQSTEKSLKFIIAINLMQSKHKICIYKWQANLRFLISLHT